MHIDIHRLMMPLSLRPEWTPGVGLADLKFGEPIAPFLEKNFAWMNDCYGKGFPGGPHPLLRHYDCEELECTVMTVMGIIHKIFHMPLCLYQGYNLVGMDRQRLLDLLKPAEPQIGYDNGPDPEDTAAAWMIRYPELGLVCDVPFATSFVYSLALTGTGPAHAERQRLIDQQAASNVVLFERRSLVTFVEP